MRDEKQLLLNEIREKVDASTSMFVVSYAKLPANDSWNLRNQLAKDGSLLEIVRKRVFLKVVEMVGIQIDESLLKGHVGVVFVNQSDAMAPAKTIFKYQATAQTLQVLLGRMDGKIVSGAELEMLSKLPGIDELRAQFLALLVSPMSLTLSVFDAAILGPLSEGEQKTNVE